MKKSCELGPSRQAHAVPCHAIASLCPCPCPCRCNNVEGKAVAATHTSRRSRREALKANATQAVRSQSADVYTLIHSFRALLYDAKNTTDMRALFVKRRGEVRAHFALGSAARRDLCANPTRLGSVPRVSPPGRGRTGRAVARAAPGNLLLTERHCLMCERVQ